ncbi:hypothetical protein Lesp01_02240 [Lentzea sp. NBRC 102530]|nr:hypothetical protein Lesp01_02240 [Lentzea sp. NBRC 102530]
MEMGVDGVVLGWPAALPVFRSTASAQPASATISRVGFAKSRGSRTNGDTARKGSAPQFETPPLSNRYLADRNPRTFPLHMADIGS